MYNCTYSNNQNLDFIGFNVYCKFLRSLCVIFFVSHNVTLVTYKYKFHRLISSLEFLLIHSLIYSQSESL